MSLTPRSPSNDQGQPSHQRETTPKTTGKLRSTCDSCRQSKVRCSGGNPCLTCQKSFSRCIYSPSVRLGRPKGSKNKTSAQNKNGNNEKFVTPERKVRRDGDGIDIFQRTETGHQIPSESSSLDSGLGHGFDIAIADEYLVDPQLISFDFMNATPEDSQQSYLDQTISTLTELRRSCSTPLSETSGFSKYISDDEFMTVDPLAGDSTLSRPFLFPGGNPAAPDQFIPAGLSQCSCLQQLAQLLYNLEDLQHSPAGSFAVDSVLRGLRLAQPSWKSLMQCIQCQNKTNQSEAFLLFAISIRILLCSIQKLNASLQCANASSGIVVSLGKFEMSGRAKVEVISVAVQRALKTITSALLHLWQRAGRPRSFPIADPNNSDTSLGNSTNIPGTPGNSPGPFTSDLLTTGGPGTEHVSSLLSTLHCIMEVMKQKP